MARAYPVAALLLGLGLAYSASDAVASDCAAASVGKTPLDDLGAGLYLGQFQGGLYPGGSNAVPSAHAAEGLERAAAVEPLDASGQPSASGRYVLLSIGMSNTTQEFCSAPSTEPCDAWTFMGKAAVHPGVNRSELVLVNGARGGQAASTWDSPTDSNYDFVRDARMAPKGLSEAQVQVVWIKEANPGPSVALPAANADARLLEATLGNVVRAVRTRYPNVKIVFLSSRIYAGYADTSLNPEPYAYESGFAVKWLIEAQIDQVAGGGIDPIAGDLDFDSAAPWLAWGSYPWADGTIPRSDGLVWNCGDFQSDGTHPAQPGEEKVADLLLDFMLSSPFATPWFRAPAAVPSGSRTSLALLVAAVLAAAWCGLRRKEPRRA